MAQSIGTKLRVHHFKTIILALLVALTLKLSYRARCEAKEFDWSDLGVSLSSPRSPLHTAASNNLRILVSPQRRMTKSYELEYANYSQPSSAQSEASYVIPGSSSNYGTQASSSLATSSAYSALSASLASLKNRLSARGVTLSGPLQDASSQTNLYTNPTGSYAISDSQQSQAQANQAQATYLSVPSQQDQPSPNAYSTQGQSNENKTIVLAIPAKINFLTDGRPKQQQPSAQQLTVLQQGNEQIRNDYSAKQLSLSLNNPESTIDPNSHVTSREIISEQEHPSYVLVNSQTTPNDPSQLVASSLSHQSGSVYQTLYPAAQTSNLGGYTVKHIQSYNQPQVIQKIYPSEPATGYDSNEQQPRYGCIDTCNSVDPRWKKYTVSEYKHCCPRSAQYDTQLELPSADKLSDNSKRFDDAYYQHLNRRFRSRRSRRPHRSFNRHNHRYQPLSYDEDGSTGEGSSRLSLNRHHDSPHMKYYKNRQHSGELSETIHEQSDLLAGKYGPSKGRSFRRGRARDFDLADAHDSNDDDGSYPPGYGVGLYSVEAGSYSSELRNRTVDDDDPRASSYEDLGDSDSHKISHLEETSDYSSELVPDVQLEENSSEPEPVNTHKLHLNRRRKNGKGRSRKAGRLSKKVRKGKYNKQDHLSIHNNGSDYDSAQQGELYNQEHSGAGEEEQSNQRDSTSGVDNGEIEKDTPLSSNKYKSTLNDSTVVSLSKTTMHLKEILSILEKKTQLKANDSSISQTSPPPTSTPAPVTTTSVYPSLSIFGSQFSSPSIQSALSTDYLTSELNLKNPYSFDSASLSSSLSSPLPSPLGSLGTDPFNPISSYGQGPHGIASTKHYSIANHGHNQRKRRIPKNLRYNDMMLSKAHGYGASSALLQAAAGKNSLMNSAYYSALHYPYWYTRGSSPMITNSYPYRNKNHFQPLSPMLSKLAAASSVNYYSDTSDGRVSGYDPISSVASSLRPSASMRMRSKPFVFNPHVLPIYTRHTILTKPADVKK